MRASLALLTLSSLLAATGNSQTFDAIDETFSVSGTPEIRVSNEDGRTEIRAHARAEVVVRATKEVVRARDRAEAETLAAEVTIRVEHRGNKVEVITERPKRHWTIGRDASVLVHLDIQVPAKSNLDVTSEDGAVTVSGLDGRHRLSVEDGDLEVLDSIGRFTIVTEDGDVRLVGVDGDVSITSEDGDVTLRGVVTRLSAETDDGSVDVKLLPRSEMGADWSLRAADGPIRIELPDDFSAELDIRVDDGSIDVDPPVQVHSSSRGRMQSTLNGGGHTLKVRTDDGSVHVTRP